MLRRVKVVFRLAVGLLLMMGCSYEDKVTSGTSQPPMAAESASVQHKTWHQYGGGPDQSKYMDLKEITKANVNQLQVLWTYTNGDSGVFFNPIVVDRTMYVVAENSSIVAIDAVTGKELWNTGTIRGILKTGISYWENKDKTDRRLLICAGEELRAVDANSGKFITNFGVNGATSLKEGLDRDPATIGREAGTTPGQIYDNLIFLGSSPGEALFSAPGHLRAYDVVTGKLVWMFHTIPFPGEPGYETWPKDAYKYAGGVNTWGEITVDEKNGIAYFPLGAPTYDYFGADRTGDDLYEECILALDARTGKHLWHFQAIHHGLWDYDLTAAAQLITVRHNGKKVEAIAVASKQGFLYVFNRITGEPLWPIVERPVPPSDVPEEHASPTQPFPTAPPPFTRQNVTTNDINPYLPPEEKAALIKRIAAARTGLYQPLSDKYEVIAMPGARGGANRGLTAADPDKGIVYVMSGEYPSLYPKMRRDKPIPNSATGYATERSAETVTNRLAAAKSSYVEYCQACHGTNMTGLPPAIPSIVNAGTKMSFDQFRTLMAVGKGVMPGNPHVDDTIATNLYTLIGGIVQTANVAAGGGGGGRRGGGGGFQRARGLGPNGAYGYPEGVAAPTNYYASTSFGMEHPNLLSPPWSTVTAYDLNKGTIKWRTPLGQDPKITPIDGKPTGIPDGAQRHGMLITSTGLVFATCLDGKLYAYDADDGKILWSIKLPSNTEGLPTMYEVNGRAYIAICLLASNGRESGQTTPPGYVVYGLPEK